MRVPLPTATGGSAYILSPIHGTCNFAAFPPYFPPSAARGIISAMDDIAQKLADLASARADLVKLLASAVQKLSAARTALFVATPAGFDPDTVFDAGDGGVPISPTQLSNMIKEFESEEARIRELLAQVDARLAEILPVAPGSVH